MKKNNNALVALTTAALTLPGMVPVSAIAESPVDEYTASYRFTKYSEDSQPASFDGDILVGEEVDRYDISVHQLSLLAPVHPNVALKFDVISETMSGASPLYIRPGANGESIQVMSGATIDEQRNEINATADIYRANSRIGIGVNTSEENDYDSKGGGVNSTLWFNGKNTTVDFGASFSIDQVTPTLRNFTEDKDSLSTFVGFSQVIDKTLLVGANLSYTRYDGYLSDPYKLASVDGFLEVDSRPNERDQIALDLQLRKFFPIISTALHADYRFYDDSWGTSSNTISLAAYKNIDTWQLLAKLRWYDQDNANFYRPFYETERADGYYSSDYRLSSYDAVSLKLGVNKKVDFGTLYLSYETYDSNGDNPGLIDFDFITAGIDYSF